MKRYIGVTLQQCRTILDSDWNEGQEADLGIALVELFAYVGDVLSHYQDLVATESYLETARKRLSISKRALYSILRAAQTVSRAASEIVARSIDRE